VPLALPSLTVDSSSGRATARTSSGGLFRPGELTELLGFDHAEAPPWPVERCIPLVDRRWVVGRRAGAYSVWRVVAEPDLERLGHPAWLWTSPDWLDSAHAQRDHAADTPPAHPLRALLRRARAAAPSTRLLCKAIGGAIALLRAHKPVAIVVPDDALRDAAQPAQALGLVLLTVLPPAWRQALRISVGDTQPGPAVYDVVITNGSPEGYELVDLADPPDEGDDLVGYYIRNRLMADDKEAVEAAAFLAEPSSSDDPWGAGVAALLRAGVEGATTVDPAWIEADPERAVRALTARLRSGAPVDPVLDVLVAVTRATRDPRPWRALARHPATQRARAVTALLAHAATLHPGAELVRLLASTYPRGAALEAWIASLLGWLHEGVDQEAVTAAVQSTLEEWPLAATRATRTSVWSEVVYGLVALGHDEAAMDALVSPVARQLALDGSSRALAANWSVVPASFRDKERLGALVRLFAKASDGGQAVIDLLRHVHGQPDEGEAIIAAWVAAQEQASADDPLFHAIRGTSLLDCWLVANFEGEDPFVAGDRIKVWARGDDDPLWVAAEQVQNRLARHTPRDRFVALAPLAHGLQALEPKARRLFGDALPSLRFPDAEVVSVALLLAEVDGASPLWGWVVGAAAPVGRFEDAILDDLVVTFCAEPPELDTERQMAIDCAQLLGAAPGWDALEVARWLVRICLAQHDASRMPVDLSIGLLHGVAKRTDGLPILIGVGQALLELPAEHPAAVAFVTVLLPSAWPRGIPRLLKAALDDEVPSSLRGVWDHLPVDG